MDSALYYYYQCLDIEKQKGDDFGAGKTLNSVGTIYLSLNKTDSAVIILQLALRYSVNAGDTANVAFLGLE